MRVKIRCECLSLRLPDLGIVMIRGETRIVESHAFQKSKFLSRALDSRAIKILDGESPITQIQNTNDLLEYLNKNREPPKDSNELTIKEINKLESTIKALASKLEDMESQRKVEVRERVVIKEVPTTAPNYDNLSIELLQALMEKVDKISSAPPQVVYQQALGSPSSSSSNVNELAEEENIVFIPSTIRNDALEADVRVSSTKSEASASFDEASKALKARPKRSKRNKKTGESK